MASAPIFEELGLVSLVPVGTKIVVFTHHTYYQADGESYASLALKVSPEPAEGCLPFQPPGTSGNSVAWLAMGDWSGFHGWWHASHDDGLVVAFNATGNDTRLNTAVFTPVVGSNPPALRGFTWQGDVVTLTHFVTYDL